MANVGKPKHNASRDMTPEWLKNKDKTYVQSQVIMLVKKNKKLSKNN